MIDVKSHHLCHILPLDMTYQVQPTLKREGHTEQVGVIEGLPRGVLLVRHYKTKYLGEKLFQVMD